MVVAARRDVCSGVVGVVGCGPTSCAWRGRPTRRRRRRSKDTKTEMSTLIYKNKGNDNYYW